MARAGSAEGKDDLFLKFHKILRGLEVVFSPTLLLVVADLHPESECLSEAEKWRKAVRQRFPKAELCLSIWELEAWLLADPVAVGRILRKPNFRHANPDRIGGLKPSAILEDAYRQAFGYERGKAYDKEADGGVLAGELNFDAASRNSPSFAHFLRALASKQERLQ